MFWDNHLFFRNKTPVSPYNGVFKPGLGIRKIAGRWGLIWPLLLAGILASCGPQDSPPATEQSAYKFVTVTPPPTATPLFTATPTVEKNAAQGVSLINVAAAAGLNFTHGVFQTSPAKDPAAMMGGGLCWIDIDNDGRLDLYAVNSYALHEVSYLESQGGLPQNALFHNQGNGTFNDISAASNTNLAMRGNGCVAADFNKDGWWDLLVTADGPNALLWNNGDGTFTEGAAAAGVNTPEWNSTAAVADLNRDGWPDLFVGAFINMENKIPNPSGAFPQDFYGLPDHLYLNNGPGPDGRVTFREITQAAGLTKEERALGSIFSDLDQDGDLDLYIANDGHRNRLYINQPAADDPNGLGFRLVDKTADADVGDSGSGMGIAGGDYDGDGRVDLLITNWQRELNALYRNETEQPDQPTFQYSTYRIGISGLGNDKTAWGAAWIDLEHDTDLDLLVAHGKVPITDLQGDSQLVRLYRNRSRNSDGSTGRAGQFLEGTEQVGLKALGPLMARGSAVADYDNDGDLDVAINTIGGPLVLLENRGEHGNWLQVSVDGFYPGLKVKASLPNGQQLVREYYAGSSYLASEDPRLHFGLGSAGLVSQLEIYWPDGRMDTIANVPANQILYIPAPPGE